MKDFAVLRFPERTNHLEADMQAALHGQHTFLSRAPGSAIIYEEGCDPDLIPLGELVTDKDDVVWHALCLEFDGEIVEAGILYAATSEEDEGSRMTEGNPHGLPVVHYNDDHDVDPQLNIVMHFC